MSKTKKPLFEVGRLLITPNALDQITHDDILRALSRHVTGDWGDVSEHDGQENNYALGKHLRIFSVYWSEMAEKKFWIITEADRSATTVLMPEDY